MEKQCKISKADPFIGWGLLLVILAMLLSSCEPEKKDHDRYDKVFSGKHELRKFNKDTYVSSSFSGSYFFIFGSASGKTEEVKEIAFSWKNYNGEYIYSRIPLDKVRIKFDSTATKPYITFKYRANWYDPEYNIQETIIKNISYIVISCREEDYPPNINLNQLE